MLATMRATISGKPHRYTWSVPVSAAARRSRTRNASYSAGSTTPPMPLLYQGSSMTQRGRRSLAAAHAKVAKASLGPRSVTVAPSAGARVGRAAASGTSRCYYPTRRSRWTALVPRTSPAAATAQATAPRIHTEVVLEKIEPLAAP